MTAPVRLRLSRLRGANLQAHSREVNGLPAVVVTRPGPWGNPFTIADMGSAEAAVARFRAAVIGPILDGKQCAPNAHPDSFIGRIIRRAPIELRGRNLACACALDAPCHADVLLELARRPTCEAVDG
jgi:hypothetical protein